jgi:large subunit ribosomal protein L15
VRTGFRSLSKKEYAIVNLSQLEDFDENTVITPDFLLEKRIIRSLKAGLKVLGDGEISKKLTVQAHQFSTSAAEKIRSAGGSAEVI